MNRKGAVCGTEGNTGEKAGETGDRDGNLRNCSGQKKGRNAAEIWIRPQNDVSLYAEMRRTQPEPAGNEGRKTDRDSRGM